MSSTYDDGWLLARRADQIAGPDGRFPGLFAFTDPERTPDPVALARNLPPGCGLVLRTFGRPELEQAAFAIAEIAGRSGLMFLVAANAELAAQAGAHGVHWPQARLRQAGRHRSRFPVMSASAHDPMAVRRAGRIADLVFVSTAFASNSASAARALGPFRLAAYARRSDIPVYALGGVNSRSVLRLQGLGLAGAAAVEGVMSKNTAGE